MVRRLEKIPRRFWDDDAWANEHYAELVKKYPLKWVAVVRKKVIAVGDSPASVREEARRKTGEVHIPITFVEGGITVY
jgi:hypothetical protein